MINKTPEHYSTKCIYSFWWTEQFDLYDYSHNFQHNTLRYVFEKSFEKIIPKYIFYFFCLNR